MAYLRCNKCEWSQDDFWSKGYNPLRSLLDWEDSLLEKFNEKFPGDSEWIKQNGDITYQELIARELEYAAQRVRRMKWKTQEEFLKDYRENKAVCPRCGRNDDWDID